MVSFSCEGCGDVLTKKKLDPHRNHCRGAPFTCLDCMVTFQGNDYRSHTSCISEAQKYQGALYKPEKSRAKPYLNTPRKAYVEDAPEDSQASQMIIVEAPLPPAPSPPSAVPEREIAHEVNVFDFLVHGDTPNASSTNLPPPMAQAMLEEAHHNGTSGAVSQDLMRVQHHANPSQDSLAGLVEYGTGPVPNGLYRTPAPREDRDRRKEKKDREPRESRKDREHRSERKDKKRKRLHVDTARDEVMTDAPPILHSGLTGGLNRLLSRPAVFPPSPDYSGGDAPETPGSPLKKAKHANRRSRLDGIGNNLSALVAPAVHTSSREHSAETRHRRRKHRRHDRSPRPEQDGGQENGQLVRYRRRSSEEDGNESGGAGGEDSQMTLYRPRAEMLLDFVNKGPESERGVSMNKALKRYHRERHAAGEGGLLPRAEEEKELWRSLRMKRNDRGEIVLFLG